MAGTRLLGSALPVVAAPMAGGPTTVALAAAVAGAGGFPFLAGGYLSAETLATQITQLRAHTETFGVNLFVPGRDRMTEEALRAYADELAGEAAVHGVALDPRPIVDDDQWQQKLDLLLSHPVPVVSCTFALPSPAEVAALHRVGTRVLATVTTAAEAVAAAATGVDGLVVQGPAAGGHSATLDPGRIIEDRATVEVLREVLDAVDLPVIAAGGVDGPAATEELLGAGAEAVAVGTLLLLTDEAGTPATHRAALVEFDRTTVTHAFTGRPARALLNGFTLRHGATAPLGYPEVHHLTRQLRRAAAAAGDADRLHLWAGTGFRSAPTGPAAEVVRWLAGQ